MKRFLIGMLVVFASALCLSPSPAIAQQTLVIKPLAEKKVTELPAGPLFWRLENFPALAQAQAAAGPTGISRPVGRQSLALHARSGGWRHRRAAPRSPRLDRLPNVVATQYLLRINEASGPPGSITAVHTHPGSEAFYVLAGETSSRTPDGVMRVGAGEGATGHGADTPMQVSSSGSTDLHSLVMFVVDAAKPFSSPAKFP